MFKTLKIKKLIRNLKLEIRNYQSGFTLIEVLIYSAILGIFLGGAFSFMSSILGGSDVLLEKNEITANTELVKWKIKWLIGQATSITVPLVNSSGTQLTMNGSIVSIFPAVFQLSNNQITLSLANQPAVALTNNRITVNQFQIEHFSNRQATSTLRISLDTQSAIYSNLRSTSTFYYVLQ